MAKKLSLTNLEVQSFVTKLDGRDSGGVQVVAVCFGASICPPCTREIPCTQTCDPEACQAQSNPDNCQVLTLDGDIRHIAGHI